MFLLAGISLSVGLGIFFGAGWGCVAFAIACVLERWRFYSTFEGRVQEFRREQNAKKKASGAILFGDPASFDDVDEYLDSTTQDGDPFNRKCEHGNIRRRCEACETVEKRRS